VQLLRILSKITKVGVLRDSHYLFSTPYRKFEWFFGGKKKKTVLAGLRLKKQQWDCPWRAASWRHNRTGADYSSTVLFWLLREINGDKVATIQVFTSADN
jgi:hypothetical protein